MCELFGLSSDRPVPAGELLCRYGARGGGTAGNPDVWDLAVLTGKAFQLTKEPLPAADSTRCITHPRALAPDAERPRAKSGPNSRRPRPLEKGASP